MSASESRGAPAFATGARAAIKLHPGYSAAYNKRGNAYRAIGDKEKAAADYKRALAINPSLQAAKDGLKALAANP